MTITRIDSAVCAAWIYTDERDEECFKLVARVSDGKWLEIDQDGVAYDQSPDQIRKFMADWIEDAALDPEDPGPTQDTRDVYEAAAQFIEAAS